MENRKGRIRESQDDGSHIDPTASSHLRTSVFDQEGREIPRQELLPILLLLFEILPNQLPLLPSPEYDILVDYFELTRLFPCRTDPQILGPESRQQVLSQARSHLRTMVKADLEKLGENADPVTRRHIEGVRAILSGDWAIESLDRLLGVISDVVELSPQC